MNVGREDGPIGRVGRGCAGCEEATHAVHEATLDGTLGSGAGRRRRDRDGRFDDGALLERALLRVEDDRRQTSCATSNVDKVLFRFLLRLRLDGAFRLGVGRSHDARSLHLGVTGASVDDDDVVPLGPLRVDCACGDRHRGAEGRVLGVAATVRDRLEVATEAESLDRSDGSDVRRCPPEERFGCFDCVSCLSEGRKGRGGRDERKEDGGGEGEREEGRSGRPASGRTASRKRHGVSVSASVKVNGSRMQ